MVLARYSELLESPNLNHFDIKHIASMKEWKDIKVNNKSGREGCWRKLRAELKGEEDVARDKADAPKPKRRLLDINESDNYSDGESKMDELTRFRNFNICK